MKLENLLDRTGADSLSELLRRAGHPDTVQASHALDSHRATEVVRSSVEKTLNGLLDAEARYEHSPERVDTRPHRLFRCGPG
jgi:hypothetical protein